MKKLRLLFILLFILNASYAQDATYSLDFISNWNNTTHPHPGGSFPSTAHWSRLVGTTHNANIVFWELGQLATTGVEEVAENGVTTFITQEINTSISNGNAYQVINLDLGFGNIFTFEAINVDADFPYISLMTMLAPSPDWLAEINSVKLTDNLGNWLSSISIDVYATDSGTDSGADYGTPDSDTNPPENIRSLQGISPFSDEKIATFVFSLDQILNVNDVELKKSISIYPNPSNGKISIKTSGNTILENIEIYTVNGQRLKVYNNLKNQKTIELKSLSSGLYFLKLNSDKGSITKKFVVQ